VNGLKISKFFSFFKYSDFFCVCLVMLFFFKLFFHHV